MKDAALYRLALILLQSTSLNAMFLRGKEQSRLKNYEVGYERRKTNIFAVEKSQHKNVSNSRKSGAKSKKRVKGMPSERTSEYKASSDSRKINDHYPSQGNEFRLSPINGKNSSSKKSKEAQLNSSDSFLKSSKSKGMLFSMEGKKKRVGSKGKALTETKNKGSSKIIEKGSYKSKGKGPFSTKGKGQTNCSARSISVQSFNLVDATRGICLHEIKSGDELVFPAIQQLYGTDSFAIECVTHGPVQSVSMSDNYGGGSIDSEYPWTLSGAGGSELALTPLIENPGIWYILCQPFCGSMASGEAGKPIAVMFTVLTGAKNAPTMAPVIGAISTPTNLPSGAPVIVPLESPTTTAPSL